MLMIHLWLDIAGVGGPKDCHIYPRNRSIFNQTWRRAQVINDAFHLAADLTHL